MPTTKHRISVTPSEALYDALAALSRKRKRALSSISLELIERALELEEDAHFSHVADDRLSRPGEKRIAHDRAWK
jgi:predicted DNA-binding protein